MLNQKKRRVWILLCSVFFVLTLGGAALALEPMSVLDSYIAAWNSHDPSRCAAHFDKDIVFYDATVGTPVKGSKNAEKEIVQSFMKAVPDLKLERDKDVLLQGDSVAWRWTFSGTNTGGWSDGTEATNKGFEIQGMTLMKIKDGKIIYSGDYYDAYGFYKQLGLVE